MSSEHVIHEEEGLSSPLPRQTRSSNIDVAAWATVNSFAPVDEVETNDPAFEDGVGEEKMDVEASELMRGMQVHQSSESNDGFGDVNIPDELLSFAFFQACDDGKWKQVKALLKRGQDRNLFTVDTLSPLGLTPLAIATRARNVDVMKGLLRDGGAKPNEPSKGGLTPLHFAVILSDSDELVSLLLKSGCDPDAITEDGTTPVIIAAMNGKATTLELLLGPIGNGDPNSQRHGTGGTTPLYAAAHQGHLDAAAALIRYGALIDLYKEGGFTPLFAATEQNQLEMVRLLLEAGADPNSRDYRKATPLFVACVSNHLDIVKELCSRRQTVLNYAGVAGGITPLYISCELGHLEVVRALLDAHIPAKLPDINQTTRFGALPIHIAAENGHVDVVKLLLSRGSPRNPAVAGPRKWLTPLYLASQNNHAMVVHTLLWWEPGDDEKLEQQQRKQQQDKKGKSVSIAAEAGATFVKVGGTGNGSSGLSTTTTPVSPTPGNKSRHTPVPTKKSKLLKALADAQDAVASGQLSTELEQPFTASNQSDKTTTPPLVDESELTGVPPVPPHAQRHVHRRYLEKPLFAACRKGSGKAVRVLLDAGVNPDCIREDSRATPLFTACLHGHMDVASQLVLAGADPNRADKAGVTPILKAVKTGNPMVLRFLVQCGASLADVNPINGRLPLHEAAEIGNIDVIAALLDMNARINAQDNDGKSALAVSVLTNQVGVAEFLLQHGADPLLTDRYGLSPLYGASRNGSDGIVRLVLASKAVAGNMEHINRRNKEDGSTSVFAAARTGAVACVEALIEAGADLNAIDDAGETPLMIACKLGHTAAALALISGGANVACLTPAERYTALHYAASGGYDTIVKALVAAKASKDLTSASGGCTPLVMAMMAGRTPTVNLLLDVGANAAIPDASGMTTLHFAIQLGDMELLDRLLAVPSVRAAINAVKRPDRSTPLFLACELGIPEAVHRLLELPDSGINVELRNSVGATPLFIASQEGHASIVKMLLDAGADPNATACPPDNIFPLFAACTSGHTAAAQALLIGGANINTTTHSGATAFHAACAEGHLAVAIVLLRAGIDYHVRAIDGKTGMEVARKFGHNAFVSSLKPLIRSIEREVTDAADRKKREALRQQRAEENKANEDLDLGE